MSSDRGKRKPKKKSKFFWIVRWPSDRFKVGGFEYEVADDEMEAHMILDEKKNGRVFKTRVVDEWVNVQPRKNSILRRAHEQR